MLEARNICKSFGKNQVLKGIDLQIDHGDVVVILGPSGSGKTTLLRCINCLEKADSGTLTIGDTSVDLHRATSRQILRLRRKTGFVFQNYNLFLNKNAVENVMEGLVTARKTARKDARAIAESALDSVGLSDKYLAWPGQLSGGQQQRVGIARAIALNPEVILFDEPTSALDPELVGEALEMIKKVARSGITTIIVTHEMSFAYEIADRIIFMDDGVIVEEGTPREVFNNPREERTKSFFKRIQPELYSYQI